MNYLYQYIDTTIILMYNESTDLIECAESAKFSTKVYIP